MNQLSSVGPGQNLLNDLCAALAKEPSFLDGEGQLLRAEIVARAFRLDAALLRLLMASEPLKRAFFRDIDGVLVFDAVHFQDFVSNRELLPDSFTAFSNKIGLASGGRALRDQGEVVLEWPYKDCVLEGGQTKEEQGRREVFWNQTLAPDDITRLFEPKALTGWERWDAEAVAAGQPVPVGDVRAEDNLLLKGNNLLALYSLKTRFAGKVKLIYIDPPYNTGNDGFRYNDRFNHSSWLTFMRNRLEVAKRLLRPDGSIWVSLDDNEAHYGKVLMDEVFGRDNFKCSFVWQKVDSPNDNKVAITPDHEFILCYEKKKDAAGFRQKGDESLLNAYRVTEEEPRPHRDRLLKKNGKNSLRSDRPTMWFGLTDPDGEEVWPIHDDGREACWAFGKRGIKRIEDEQRLIWKRGTVAGRETWIPYAREFAKEEPKRPHATILLDVKTTRQAKAHATELFGDQPFLDTLKPEELVARILEIGTAPGDLVVDFFVGTGTTAAVAMKMKRHWIAVEQMDYVRTMASFRLKKVIAGDTGGVSEAMEWQGGGGFVYAELARWNGTLVERIEAAANDEEIAAVRDEVLAKGYLRHEVDAGPLASDDFAALSLDKRKGLLIEALDLNHLHVARSDMEDATYGLSDEDRRLTRSFYGEGA